jgi:tetratricopeptide (TPR) repeat protein
MDSAGGMSTKMVRIAFSPLFEARLNRLTARSAFILVTIAVFVIPMLRDRHVLVAAGPGAASPGSSTPPAAITIDYPEEGSILPPEITPPTFLWRDRGKTATMWRIDVSFADGSPGIHTTSKGEHMRIGQIDPSCIAETNELPKLTPRQAATWIWIPDVAMWESIKKHSTAGAATVTIAGFDGSNPDHAVSRGRVAIRTSNDPVGAPIFYRDVPLMPTETEKGIIKPLAPYAVRLIRWRLRNIGESRSRVLLENLPVCANCHSFSGDGKTLGMDLDGLQNNKGLYTLSPVKPELSIRNENVIQWSTARGKLQGKIRVGFMSQVSPHGQYVVTTIDPYQADGAQQTNRSAARSPDPTSNYYVANFKDYRFLQVFYPTRGVLAWYSRTTGILHPLPGADDPRYVQMGGVWSPDGKYLVFARAEAEDPYLESATLAKFANDPNERQIRYDLYLIPFSEGKGGTPEPISGASRNGMSNSFPKISPDGRWIVFVKCRNGLLMRPDSQLYIVPATGGEARRMRCNTTRMNSWHSFSPNSRWLVFSSKSRSAYTQMYLTHVDEEGNDSPAILIENTTAANRAVNIPEFVNIAPDGLLKIGGPAVEYYRLVDHAEYLRKKGQYQESIAEWKKVLDISPDDALAHSTLGALLLMTGHPEEAAAHLNRARQIRLDQSKAPY